MTKWLFIPALDVYVCIPAKCGGTSVYCALLGDHKFHKKARLHAEEAFETFTKAELPRDGKPKYLAVRHPVERFASLWRNKCRDAANRPGGGVREVADMTPAELLDHVRANPCSNEHWIPQAAFWRDDVTVVPHTDMLATLGFSALHFNKSRPDDTAMPVEGLLEHYAEDLELWSKTQPKTNSAP